MTDVPVKDVAKALSVHPRTVWRAYKSDRDSYWDDDERHNPTVKLEVIAEKFSMTPAKLKEVMAGGDTLYSQKEIAEKLEVEARTFRRRKYPVCAKHNRIVRYSWYDTFNYHVRKHARDDDPLFRKLNPAPEPAEEDASDLW